MVVAIDQAFWNDIGKNGQILFILIVCLLQLQTPEIIAQSPPRTALDYNPAYRVPCLDVQRIRYHRYVRRADRSIHVVAEPPNMFVDEHADSHMHGTNRLTGAHLFDHASTVIRTF